MKIEFWHSTKPRERLLSEAFLTGARLHGDDVSSRFLDPEAEVGGDDSPDVACMVGVKSRELYRKHLRAGTRIVYMDKGYVRGGGDDVIGWRYWRVAIGAHHPTEYLEKMEMPPDRWSALGLTPQPWRASGSHIVLAGSSEKYHEFYGLKHPTAWASKTIARIRELQPDRKIIYRPKPSWRAAEPIKGTELSRGGSIDDVLRDAHALVTHGSNATFEAMLAGVPSVVLGNAVARPISSTTVDEIAAPRLATDQERHQLLWNLAYFQWTMREMADGACWAFLRPLVFGL